MATSTISKFAIVLALAAVAGLVMVPAFGDEHNRQGQGHGQGHGQGRGGDHGNNRYAHGGGYYGHDNRDNYYPYAYAQPVYAPPPVYYPPMPSPGISLFFPLELR